MIPSRNHEFERYRKCLYQNLETFNCNKFEAERKTIRDHIIETVQFGKSNFIQLIGDHSTGCSVVREVLNQLELDNTLSTCQLIRLNGILYDSDDMVFKAIAKKLQCDETFEEAITGSNTDFMNFVVKSLRESSGDSKPLVLVLETFDLFCDHERTFLYNLFDVMNHQQAPIFVVGITENNCCMDQLIERTKSRSSNVPVYLLSNISLEDRLASFRSILFINDKTIVKKKEWNEKVVEISNESAIKKLLKDMLKLDQTEELFVNFMRRSISYMKEEPLLNCRIFEKSFDKIVRLDTTVRFKIKDLTILEHCLLISIYHHCTCQNTKSFNFEMIYDRYSTVSKRSQMLPKVDRSLAFKAFQTLTKFRIIVAKESEILDTIPYQFVTYELLFSKEIIREIIEKEVGGTRLELKQWIKDSLFHQ